ncbi:hypothetical protein E8E13_006303 [Curvularia kusanoi]|uniref:Uncharacterized protein n=1 Tax=Curvularia kusanoi TaxID=90978 RepID=A0A9P4TAN1_CURKU|nr:hypothetical protein E8E13_006303 [Curvularia kusanoi]
MRVANNNAFGAGAPSWNHTFPEGNLTAAEILAYFPHWLKSVDVVYRFVNHGGRAPAIAYLIAKYRDLPRGGFHGNSVTVMMQYAVRQTGNEGWTVAIRDRYEQEREYPETSLYVGDFRPPRITHPKRSGRRPPATLNCNKPANPIPFKDLARHVKEHPSDDDALDLTRCVQYAVNHPNEEWNFPDDYKDLVEHIGGATPVTRYHHDRQLFGRYSHLHASSPVRPPRSYKRKLEKGSDVKGKGKAEAAAEAEAKVNVDESYSDGEGASSEDSEAAPSPLSSKMSDNKPAAVGSTRTQRRSGRRPNKKPVYAEKDASITDDDDSDDGDAERAAPPRKRRQLTRIPPTTKDEESEFEAKDEPDSEDSVSSTDVQVDIAPEEQLDLGFDGDSTLFSRHDDVREPMYIDHTRVQDVEDQGLNIGQHESDMLVEHFHYARAHAQPAHLTFDMMQATSGWMVDSSTAFFAPPILPEDHLPITFPNVHILAHETCRTLPEQWNSAFAVYRFGGPRRSRPYRELHRLSKPYDWDTSDWAENVRWAEQQHKLFGSTTWTEDPTHLETITFVRESTMWTSETALAHRVSLPLGLFD